ASGTALGRGFHCLDLGSLTARRGGHKHEAIFPSPGIVPFSGNEKPPSRHGKGGGGNGCPRLAPLPQANKQQPVWLHVRRRTMAVDMFLKIEGIEGESQDSKHKSEIHLLSWNWGETQAGTFANGGGGGAGKVRMADLH